MQEIKATEHSRESVMQGINTFKEQLLYIEYVEKVEALTTNLKNSIAQMNDLNNKEPEDIREQF